MKATQRFGEYPFDVALVSGVSSWKLCLSEHDTRFLTISTCFGRESSREPGQFQGLPEALSFYFPAGWNVSPPVVKSVSSRRVINLRSKCCTAYRKIPFSSGLFYPQALPSTSPENLLCSKSLDFWKEEPEIPRDFLLCVCVWGGFPWSRWELSRTGMVKEKSRGGRYYHKLLSSKENMAAWSKNTISWEV